MLSAHNKVLQRCTVQQCCAALIHCIGDSMYSTPPSPSPRLPTIISPAQNLLTNHRIRRLLRFHWVLLQLWHISSCIAIYCTLNSKFLIELCHVNRTLQWILHFNPTFHCALWSVHRYTASLFWCLANANSWCVAVTEDNQLITAYNLWTSSSSSYNPHHSSQHHWHVDWERRHCFLI